MAAILVQSDNNEDKRNKEAGNITPNLALNDILNGLGGFGYNNISDGDGWPRIWLLTIF